MGNFAGMPAYIIVRVDIHDAEAYREYMRHTPRVVSRFGGRFIVRGGETETLEGEEETLRLVVIEFPSMDAARQFYRSDAYKETKRLRDGGGTAQFVAVDGYDVEEWERAVEESEALIL